MMNKVVIKARFLFGLLSGLLLLGLVLEQPSAALAEDLVIIANEVFPADSIASFDVMEIYTGHYVVYQRFKIRPLDQSDDQKIKRIFLDKVVRFTPEGYKSYWLKWTFKTGRQPPIVVQDSKELIQTIQKDRNGIGYVWDHEVQGTEGIKVLLRIPVD